MKRFNSNLLFSVIVGIVFLFFVAPCAAQEIKVMTYNIFHGEQYYDNGKSNLDQVADVINQYKPDFVALQEVDSMTNRTASVNNDVPQDLVKVLAEKTGMHGFFGKAIDYDNGGYGEGILSRFPVQALNYDLPIPKGGEGRALLTIAHTFPNGKKIVFAGTHLCHQFPENRLAQAEAICTIFGEEDLPIIMGGDFNFRPDTEPHQVIKNDFYDAAEVVGNPENTISFENPCARIDYIFLSKGHNWNIKNVEVIRVNASDHMPVLVTLELRD